MIECLLRLDRIILPIANMIFSNIPRETKRMDWRVGC
jgi:hypothetical protein